MSLHFHDTRFVYREQQRYQFSLNKFRIISDKFIIKAVVRGNIKVVYEEGWHSNHSTPSLHTLLLFGVKIQWICRVMFSANITVWMTGFSTRLILSGGGCTHFRDFIKVEVKFRNFVSSQLYHSRYFHWKKRSPRCFKTESLTAHLPTIGSVSFQTTVHLWMLAWVNCWKTSLCGGIGDCLTINSTL